MASSQNERFLWQVYPKLPPSWCIPSEIVYHSFGQPSVQMWRIPSEPPIENTEGLSLDVNNNPQCFLLGKVYRSQPSIKVYGLMSPCWWEKKEKKIMVRQEDVVCSKTMQEKDVKVTKYEIKTITQKMKNIKIDKKRKRLIGDGEMNWERRRK